MGLADFGDGNLVAISEILTYSRIEAQSSPESRPVRQWTVKVYELVEGPGKSPEVGHAVVVTAPNLDLESQEGCDAISGDLETVVTALLEAGDPELFGPLLILDYFHVNPKYRGRGLATTVAQEAIEWFEGLVNFVALAVTQKPKVRPAAARVVEKLGFRQLKDDVWVREL